MRRLSGLDAAFLCLETPSTPMHTMAILRLGGGSSRISVEMIRAVLQERMHLLPSLGQRLVESPFGLDRPVLVDDPDFDIADHVLRVADDSIKTDADLDRVAGILASRPVDRGRPLWEAWLFDGLDGDESAIVFKLHHAIVDGVSAAAFMAQLLDSEPRSHPFSPVVVRASGKTTETPPGTLALLGRALVNQAGLPLQAARTALGAAIGARELWAERGKGDAERSAWPIPLAPRMPGDGRLSSEREVTRGSTRFEDFRFIKQAFDATINDVLLAVCTIALRRVAEPRGGLQRRALVAAIPVSIRNDDDDAGGNRVSNMLVRLPVHVDGLENVMRYVQRETVAAKRAHQLLGSRLLIPALEATSMPAFRWLARQHERLGLSDYHPPACNIIISNIPGPPNPLYFAGVPLRSAHPFGPLMDGVALNLTTLSYAGRMEMGVMACPSRGREATTLISAFEESVEIFRDAAEHIGRR